MKPFVYTFNGPNGRVIERRTQDDIIADWGFVCHNRIMWGDDSNDIAARMLPTVENKPSHKRTPLDRVQQSRAAKAALINRIKRSLR